MKAQRPSGKRSASVYGRNTDAAMMSTDVDMLRRSLTIDDSAFRVLV
jgi:hypothetical protein